MSTTAAGTRSWPKERRSQTGPYSNDGTTIGPAGSERRPPRCPLTKGPKSPKVADDVHCMSGSCLADRGRGCSGQTRSLRQPVREWARTRYVFGAEETREEKLVWASASPGGGAPRRFGGGSLSAQYGETIAVGDRAIDFPQHGLHRLLGDIP